MGKFPGLANCSISPTGGLETPVAGNSSLSQSGNHFPGIPKAQGDPGMGNALTFVVSLRSAKSSGNGRRQDWEGQKKKRRSICLEQF